MSFILKLGMDLPVRELTALLLVIQMLISPIVAYHYFNNEATFKMYIPEFDYLSYAFWACASFILGLYSLKYKFNVWQWKDFMNGNEKMKELGLIFLGIGFLSLVLKSFIGGGFNFMFAVLSQLRFIGAFILWFSRFKFGKAILVFVYLEFAVSIIRGAIFYDLLVWLFFLFIVLELSWQTGFYKKVLYFILGSFLVFFVQAVKTDYRDIIWSDGPKKASSNNRVEIFVNVAQEKMTDDLIISDGNYLDNFISRLNTGWIVSKVMEHTPKNEPYTGGSLFFEDIENIILPRFLNPNKKSVGGDENREKFRRFTGRYLDDETTMRIGAISDAYVNFGPIGGCFLMYLYGLLLSSLLRYIYRKARSYPSIILWIPMVFTYVVRMSDFLVMLNSIWKTILVMIIVAFIFKDRLFAMRNSNAVNKSVT